MIFVARASLTPEAYTRAGDDPEGVLVERIEQLGRELGFVIEAGLVGSIEERQGDQLGAVVADVLG